MPRRDFYPRCSLRANTIVAALIGLVVAGCAQSGTPPADEIRIGHYASLSGSEATFGQSTDNAIHLAVEEVNRAGGIHGKPVRLITYDDRGDAKEAGTAVTRLINLDAWTMLFWLGIAASNSSRSSTARRISRRGTSET